VGITVRAARQPALSSCFWPILSRDFHQQISRELLGGGNDITCMWEVSCSNLGGDIGYPGWNIHSFIQFFQANASITSRPIPF
jgi:hypothetical protein